MRKHFFDFVDLIDNDRPFTPADDFELFEYHLAALVVGRLSVLKGSLEVETPTATNSLTEKVTLTVYSSPMASEFESLTAEGVVWEASIHMTPGDPRALQNLFDKIRSMAISYYCSRNFRQSYGAYLIR